MWCNLVERGIPEFKCAPGHAFLCQGREVVMEAAHLRAQVTLAAMGQPEPMAAELGRYPDLYEQIVNTSDRDDDTVYGDMQRPDSAIQAKINEFLTKYEKAQHQLAVVQGDRSAPIASQPLGSIASNSMATVLDIVQEVASLPRVTLSAVMAAMLRPDRVTYVGLVVCAVGLVLVLLDVEA